MKIGILGASGSIGSTALDKIKDFPEIQLEYLSVNINEERAKEIVKIFHPKALCLTSLTSSSIEGVKLFFGEKGLLDMIKEYKVDKVLMAISGFSALKPTKLLSDLNIQIALANKESIVCARKFLRNITPVDSEHSALNLLLKNHPKRDIKEVILTCSGGPFLNEMDEQKIYNAPIDKVLKHPTWNMGREISLHSANLANKGLEVLEAHYLFDLDIDQIKVVIHKQSIIHSLIALKSNMYYAQLSKPDMSYAIMNALIGEERENLLEALDFCNLSLDFQAPDLKRFPMLKLAYLTLKNKGSYPIIYQVANQNATSLYFENKIAFGRIPQIVQDVLMAFDGKEIRDFDQIFILKKEIDNFMKEMI